MPARGSCSVTGPPAGDAIVVTMSSGNVARIVAEVIRDQCILDFTERDSVAPATTPPADQRATAPAL